MHIYTTSALHYKHETNYKYFLYNLYNNCKIRPEQFCLEF